MSPDGAASREPCRGWRSKAHRISSRYADRRGRRNGGAARVCSVDPRRSGESEVEAIRIEGWVDDFEEHASLGLVPTAAEIEESRGTAVRLVRPRRPSIRAQWEIRLVAAAFVNRSAELGLERVVVLHAGDGSQTLDVDARADASAHR